MLLNYSHVRVIGMREGCQSDVMLSAGCGEFDVGVGVDDDGAGVGGVI